MWLFLQAPLMLKMIIFIMKRAELLMTNPAQSLILPVIITAIYDGEIRTACGFYRTQSAV